MDVPVEENPIDDDPVHDDNNNKDSDDNDEDPDEKTEDSTDAGDIPGWNKVDLLACALIKQNLPQIH